MGHVLFLVVASVVARVFVREVPGLKVMHLDLQSLELPASPPETSPIQETPPPQAQETSTPPVQEEVVIPEAPAELPLQQPPLDIATEPEQTDDDRTADVRPPDPLLPREPMPEVEVEEAQPVASTEEAATDSAKTPEAETTPTQPEEIAAEPTTTTEGGTVQASSRDGVSDFYLARVQQKIGRRWRPTPGATAGRGKAECLVHFRIGPGGEVIAPTVARSSGLSVFDRQAIRAVLESSPLPEVPPRFARSGLEIRFRFSYGG
jgi:TonB family protein